MMEIGDSSQILEVHSDGQMAVEYVDAINIRNAIGSAGSATTTITAEDGSTLPVTLIMSESDVTCKVDSDFTGNNKSENSDSVGPAVVTQSATQYVIEHITPGEVMQQTLYAIQFADGDSPTCVVPVEAGNNKDIAGGSAESALEVTNAAVDSVQHQSDLHALETTTRLEDFMDVVTTYKCKFCRFSCPWKSGLMSHIRNCHLEASKHISSKESNSNSEPSELSSSSVRVESSESQNAESSKEGQKNNEVSDTIHNEGEQNMNSNTGSESKASLPPPTERHIFLCGQCRDGFDSLQACKNHMIEDHNIKLEVAKSKEKADNPPKKRKKMKMNSCPSPGWPNGSPPEENLRADLTGDETEEISQELKNKRRIRRPKCLEDDYFLGVKRRRVKRENLNDKAYRCNEKGCGYRFSTEGSLDYHITCHREGEKFFICPECSEKADHWRGLSLHLWKEHAIDVDLHTCPECGYKTHSHFKLENHRRIHSDERLYVCSKCSKGFKQLSQLRNHYVIHIDRKNLPEKRWYSEQKCDICERTFSDSKCLRKHQQAVHNKIKPYVCTYCGHMSARKAMLQLHMRQHTGEKPFMCEHCEYRTGDHNSLRRHRMRHTGTKPYKCPHCPYACIQAISYKTHLKNKHPGMEGLFACTLCSFRSVSKDNYINHMSDHKRGVIPRTLEDKGTSSGSSSCGLCNCLCSVGKGSCMNHMAEHGKRGVNTLEDKGNTSVPPPSPGDQTNNQNSSQVHLTENTLQQLEGILPGNITAAQLIYSCLSALSQEGASVNLPPGVTAAVTGDGSQTITIQLPTAQEVDSEQYYFTIQQQHDGSAAAALVLPSDISGNCTTDDASHSMEVLHPIAIMQEDGSESQALDSNVFIETSQLDSTEANSLVIENSDTLNVHVGKTDEQSISEENHNKG